MEELPPGFRFYPTEEELVAFYLHHKLQGQRDDMNRVIPVIDIYRVEPWDLPKLAGELCLGDAEQWFFFSPRQEREARGGRPIRTTATGYWKATGSPGYVYSSNNSVIGVKKTMVFYKGKAPTGRKTKWKLNEYKAIEVSNQSSNAPKLRHEFSLCRVYVISGSFRAFDRRPLDGERGGAVAISKPEAAADRASSSETSHSGGDNGTDLPQAGESSNVNWNVNEGVGDPLWDWETLNWP
ncbi:hypothetical protein L6164_022135 [Bauhinia variegata]|uniref:Uncharacterized protein n=1 Tax=Bauhinia variegata TaxID=167791 RepID=A0ACB9ME13_BAUVA|nr:hypothetical protein L6164_022135 [Bauhinia variegata]